MNGMKKCLVFSGFYWASGGKNRTHEIKFKSVCVVVVVVVVD